MIKYFLALGVIASLIVSLIIYTFNKVGGPFKVRSEKFDQTRVQNIQSIKYLVEQYYFDHNKLPETLSEAKTESNYYQDSLKDPETEQNYEFRVTGGNRYQVCATFDTDSSKDEDKRLSYLNEQFKHPAGYHCFDFEISSTGRGPILDSTPANPLDYEGILTSTYWEIGKKKTKVAQTFKVQEDSVVKGVQSRLQFTSGRDSATVSLREFTHLNDLEASSVITQGDISVGVISEMRDQDILFKNSIKLSKDKDYVLVFEVPDGKTVLDVAYSKGNPDVSGNAYYFFDPYGRTPETATYSWNKYDDFDLKYKLLI